MNYSFYLFSKLFDVIIKHEYEYDLMFNDIQNLYKLYEISTYNDESLPEYECMVNFFTNNLEYIKNQEYLIDINKIEHNENTTN